MAHKPVGVNSSFAVTVSAFTGTDVSAHKSDCLRLIAKTVGVHVAIGTNPTATTQDYYVPADASGGEILSIGKPASQRVVGVSTSGTKTIIDFPEGTGSPFSCDAVSLTVTGQTDYNFTHKIVSSINNTAGVDGFYSTRIVVNHDSSSGNPAALTPTNSAELRGSFMVAALGTGSGTFHYQQVQSSKGANG
jgi:hypothetical protein